MALRVAKLGQNLPTIDNAWDGRHLLNCDDGSRILACARGASG